MFVIKQISKGQIDVGFVIYLRVKLDRVKLDAYQLVWYHSRGDWARQNDYTLKF